VSEQAAALGLPTGGFPFEGKLLPLAPTTFHTEAVYCTWLEARAVEFFYRHRDRLGADGYKLALKALAEAVASGAFEWESEARAASMRLLHGEGYKHFAWLRLNQCSPAATPELVDKIYAAGRAAELNAALEAADDPLARAPSASASPSAPSPPGSGNGASAAAAPSPGSTAASSQA
jgi:hypothetical protein